MSPYDWHELATKSDLADLRLDMDRRFAHVDTQLNELRLDMRDQFGDVRQEMAGLRTDVRTMLLAMIGFMLTVLLTGGGLAITTLAG